MILCQQYLVLQAEDDGLDNETQSDTDYTVDVASQLHHLYHQASSNIHLRQIQQVSSNLIQRI